MSTARIYFAPVLAGLLSVTGGLAEGQSNYQKLQDRLGGAPAAAPASDPAPGYLGGEFDDPRGTQKGVVVNAVRPGGPAEAGGLKASDLITAINGKAISNLNDLDAVLEKAVVGQELRMTVNRGGRLTDLTVRLGTRPAAPASGEGTPATTPPGALPGTLPGPRSPTFADPAPALGSPGPGTERPAPGGAFSPRSLLPPADASSPRTLSPAPVEPDTPADSSRSARPLPLGPPPATGAGAETTPARPGADQNEATPEAAGAGGGGPSLGITVDEPNDAARQRYGLTIRRGALITAVRAGSPADRAGLPVGGLVVRLDARPINSADDLVTAIRAARPGQEVELGYFEGTEFLQKSITLASASASATAGSAPRTRSGLSSDRALLGHVERKVDNFVRGGVSGPSTVYNPSAMAALQAQVADLTETVKRLEEQLHALQSGRGGAAISPPAAPAPSITPGFGTAPIGPATPGFVPGLGQPGSSP